MIQGSCLCGDVAYEMQEPVPRKDRERGIAVIPMGSLDDDRGFRPQGHIFVSDKVLWMEIHDELPQHPGAAPSA